MTVKQMEKSIEEIWDLFRETDRRMKETDRRMKETDRKIAEATKAVADLGGKWGRFVEGLVVPAVENLFKEWGIELDKVFPRVKARRNGDKMEIDVLAINGEYAMLIEVKSTLGVDDVKEHLEKLKSFKAFFPEYQDRKVLGAVAGIVIEAGADRFAYKNGLFVIGQTGETVKVLNDRKFKPREW
ncbi:MAG: DUF3782 domain-containing protein [Calditrichia bacterium]|nr:DUF3782 domain-containing protein [Calditrichia bacterium]